MRLRVDLKGGCKGVGDKLNHCMSSCEISDDCGNDIAYALGFLKEVRDRKMVPVGQEVLIDFKAKQSESA